MAGHSGDNLGWALQGESGVGHFRQTLALRTHSGVGHSRETLGWALQKDSGVETLGLGTRGRLWGWALHQDSGVGHSRDTLELGRSRVEFKI